MAETKKKSNRNIYTDNLARQNSLETEERQKRYEKIIEKNKRLNKQDARAFARINAGIDFLSMLFIAVAIVCIAYFGGRYLITSAKTAQLGEQLKTATAQLDEMKKSNDAAYSNIEASVDMGEVYEKAVGEYGMVFPGEDQIVMYDYHETGYVRQYDSIPD